MVPHNRLGFTWTRWWVGQLDLNILSRKVDYKSSVLVSPSTSLDIGTSSSNSTALSMSNDNSNYEQCQIQKKSRSSLLL